MKKLSLFLCCLLASNTYAGFNGITHHSRASCGNNESISWDWNADHWFWVNTYHYHQKTSIYHQVEQNAWEMTWRDAKVHWGEGTPGWTVTGKHWETIGNNRNYFFLAKEETVQDCSLYDGWWDRNK